MAVASLFDPFTGKEQIDEKQKLMFLISPAYCNLLRKMVVGLTADHKLMVYLLPPESPDLAFTDGSHIMINTLHQLFIAQPVGDVTKYCLALAVHESLHPIYSCFECIEDASRKKAGDTDNVIQIRRELFNILEDARIERIGAFKFPGVAYAVEALNEFLFGLPKDFTQSKDIEIMMQWILDFVSVDKTRGELKDDLKKLWMKIEPLALKAKYSDTCSGCYFYTKKILKLLKPLIPETDPIEQQRQKAQNRQGNAKDVDAKTGQQPPQGGAIGNGPSRRAQSNQPGNGQNANNGQSGQGQANSSGQGQGQGAVQGDADALTQMLANALTASFNEHQKDMAAAAQDKQTTKANNSNLVHVVKAVGISDSICANKLLHSVSEILQLHRLVDRTDSAKLAFAEGLGVVHTEKVGKSVVYSADHLVSASVEGKHRDSAADQLDKLS